MSNLRIFRAPPRTTPPASTWWSRLILGCLGVTLAVVVAVALHSQVGGGGTDPTDHAASTLLSARSASLPISAMHQRLASRNLGPIHDCTEFVIANGDKLGYTPSSWLSLSMAQAMAVGEKYGTPRIIKCRGDVPTLNSVDIQFHHLTGGPADWLASSSKAHG